MDWGWLTSEERSLLCQLCSSQPLIKFPSRCHILGLLRSKDIFFSFISLMFARADSQTERHRAQGAGCICIPRAWCCQTVEFSQASGSWHRMSFLGLVSPDCRFRVKGRKMFYLDVWSDKSKPASLGTKSAYPWARNSATNSEMKEKSLKTAQRNIGKVSLQLWAEAHKWDSLATDFWKAAGQVGISTGWKSHFQLFKQMLAHLLDPAKKSHLWALLISESWRWHWQLCAIPRLSKSVILGSTRLCNYLSSEIPLGDLKAMKMCQWYFSFSASWELKRQRGCAPETPISSLNKNCNLPTKTWDTFFILLRGNHRRRQHMGEARGTLSAAEGDGWYLRSLLFSLQQRWKAHFVMAILCQALPWRTRAVTSLLSTVPAEKWPQERTLGRSSSQQAE